MIVTATIYNSLLSSFSFAFSMFDIKGGRLEEVRVKLEKNDVKHTDTHVS